MIDTGMAIESVSFQSDYKNEFSLERRFLVYKAKKRLNQE